MCQETMGPRGPVANRSRHLLWPEHAEHLPVFGHFPQLATKLLISMVQVD